MPKKITVAKKDFEAVIGKGTLWKSVTELMTSDRITMHLSKEGMSIGHENKPLISTHTEMCIIAKFPAKNFDKYFCARPFSVSFDAADHNGFIKGSKKKVKLTITVTDPEKKVSTLGKRIYDLTFVVTSPTGEGTNSESSCTVPCHEEEPLDWQSPEEDLYRMPVTLNSTSFSQIKTFSNQESKRIMVRTQACPEPYIGFYVDSGSTKKIVKNFGKEMYPAPVYHRDSDGWVYCGVCEEYLDSCECVCEVCKKSRKRCNCSCTCGSSSILRKCECGTNPYEIVERQYPLGALLKLTKLGNMQLRFYEPKLPGPALKITFTAAYGSSILGEVEVLINEAEEINGKENK